MDDFWFVDTYKTAPKGLPPPKQPLTGASVVPWRYNLNTGELLRLYLMHLNLERILADPK